FQSFMTQRPNADGAPRHTHLKPGEDIIGWNLPGIQTDPSDSGAQRYGVAIGSEEKCTLTVEQIRKSGVVHSEIREHADTSPFIRSFRFTDFDNNPFEICMNRHTLGDPSLSHVVFETTDLERSPKFYSQALGLVFIGEDQEKHFFAFPNHQLIGLNPVGA